MKVLALYLDAPLQAWGSEGCFEIKETNSFPTRSGIIGLLSGAVGMNKYSPTHETDMKTFDHVEIVPYVITEGRLHTDFQTVHGCINPKGEEKDEALLTHRQYMLGSRFYVLVSGEDSLIDRLSSAVKNPVYGGWLGRKNCIPCSPLFAGIFKTAEDAEVHFGIRHVSKIKENRDGDSIADIPVSFKNRIFKSRKVKRTQDVVCV